MSVDAIKVIERTSTGLAVVGSSRVELVAFLNQLAACNEVQKLGEQQGVTNEEIRVLFFEAGRLLKLIRPLHVEKKAA
ncbi:MULTISPECIES: hypothetical protein [unclassified Limnobacter]|uniref:hypothetical protein n=1 Tax=unclassified Limnobacter TaxID=2630203 RepID=UPI0025C45768|nr:MULTISPECIES: hypothetical protein [unclassified Limnobacter]|tara:strand:+ start:291 stop:524 length:234 start_codon:yes stop_codon:yes gene_type:complete